MRLIADSYMVRPGLYARDLILALALLVFPLSSNALGQDQSPAAAESEAEQTPIDASTPASLIDGLHAALLGVMRDAESLGYPGRRDALEPVLAAAFDLPAMAEISVGRSWTKMDDAQKTALVEAFSSITYSTYADRFDGFSGERFETLGDQPGPQGRTWVKTQIVRSNDEPVAINYLVTPAGQSWKIVDVYLKGGISEMATRRAEYTSVIKRQGLEGLIEALNDRLEKLDKRTAG
ncbi:MAG: ABC transporter substrate-binding protein [Pseudomonadota bacterium]